MTARDVARGLLLALVCAAVSGGAFLGWLHEGDADVLIGVAREGVRAAEGS